MSSTFFLWHLAYFVAPDFKILLWLLSKYSLRFLPLVCVRRYLEPFLFAWIMYLSCARCLRKVHDANAQAGCISKTTCLPKEQIVFSTSRIAKAKVFLSFWYSLVSFESKRLTERRFSLWGDAGLNLNFSSFRVVLSSMSLRHMGPSVRVNAYCQDISFHVNCRK